MVTQNMLRTHYMKKSLWGEEKKLTALDLIKCLKQIKYQRLILTCVPFSVLPFSISTMRLPVSQISCSPEGLPPSNECFAINLNKKGHTKLSLHFGSISFFSHIRIPELKTEKRVKKYII